VEISRHHRRRYSTGHAASCQEAFLGYSEFWRMRMGAGESFAYPDELAFYRHAYTPYRTATLARLPASQQQSLAPEPAAPHWLAHAMHHAARDERPPQTPSRAPDQ